MIKINHHPPKFGLTMVCISVYWLLFCCRVSILLSCTRTHLCSSCKLPVHFHRTHVGSVRMAAGSCLVYHSTHKDRHSESNEHLRKQKETEEVRQSERQTNRQTDRQTNRQTNRQTDRHSFNGKMHLFWCCFFCFVLCHLSVIYYFLGGSTMIGKFCFLFPHLLMFDNQNG